MRVYDKPITQVFSFSRKLFILLIVYLTPFVGQTQVSKLFTTDSEISSSLINQIYQDDKGYLWIATEDGLNRYDGAKVTIYKQNENDSTSILNNYVKSIFQDRAGKLYFGFFNGLQYYDYATEEFHYIPIYIGNHYLYRSHVTSFVQRKNGDILLSTSGQGILKIEETEEGLAAIQIPNLLPDQYFERIFEDAKGDLWVLNQSHGLYRINNNNQITTYFKDTTLETSLSSIAQGKNDDLYVGSLTKGLFKYNHTQDEFIQIENSQKLPVKSLLINAEAEVMVGTDGKGLWLYDPATDKIQENDFSIANFDFTKTKIHSIIQDEANNFWLGIYQKGALLVPDKANNFDYIGYQSVKNNIIGSNSIASLIKDNEGILWVGTDGDGLYGINKDKEQTYHIETKRQQGSVSVMSLFEDSNDQVWVGTYLKGLAKLNRKSKKLDFINDFKDEQGNRVERIYSIIEDDQKNLWIGSLGYGLFKYNLDKKVFENYNVLGDQPYERIQNRWINCLLYSDTKRLYIGTYDGLTILDVQKRSFKNKEGKDHILRNKIIYNLFEDEKDDLWIGTSEGLYFKPKNDTITKVYHTTDGLPSNVICAIEQDLDKNLWISTNHGIAKLEKNTEEFKNYYFRDGLQGNEFNKNASFFDEEGKLYFGNTNGVTYFQPSQIKASGNELDLRITGFYIQDQPIKKGMKSGKYSIIAQPIIEADTIELNYRDNDFSIEFSSFTFRHQEWITYAYALNSDSWIKLRPGINTVTFNNLEPGTYTFKVKAKDIDDYSGEKKLTIIIHSPWYLSSWAKLGYFLLFLGFTYVSVQVIKNRQNTKKKLLEHEHAEQINEAKLQFLTNISHDLKTPITLIINPLNRLIKTDASEDRQKLYKVMERNSERMIHLLNQLINARKFDQGQIILKFRKTEIISFLKNIVALFEDQIESRRIDFEILHSEEELYAYIDPRHFDKIIQNLVANAIKFSPHGGNIQVKISTNEQWNRFEISIKDNGIGIKEKDIKNIFNRFYRISGDNQRQFEGTGIGLHLTKSIAELHHGTVSAKNNLDQPGCTFVITAPLGKDHLNEDDIVSESQLSGESASYTESISYIGTEEPIEDSTSKKEIHTLFIVDDDAEIRNYIASELKSSYNVKTFSSAKTAFPEVAKNPPDLIISDVVMPEMDGISFTRKIKKNIYINHVPVILLTGKTDKETNIEGLEIGVDAYINKPFNIEILRKTVRNLIKNRALLKNTYTGNQLQEDKIKKIELKSGDQALLEKFMEVVNKNIGNSDLNVEMLAGELGISRVHLYRKLKQLTNQSAGELITNIRLKQAANLIISSTTNISEVAYAVGFTSTSKFSTKFKDLYGMTPSNYRKKHLQV
ncbi:hybrid sensor histidine kinase/response regulator transcription factor [Zunongwangia pacifica]|uniref:histidine kinase n=1 Tax=Zunongwangia pacifica TaxID=2911062 RepID=A0A9X1ZRJ6_9FLAO|nr:hybrid sensor histidine kinase/response regulator transcription factor [Zunongwangia pacifica]MCL6219712.1 ATP-binding protein [Zunongwangia pacifica]